MISRDDILRVKESADIADLIMRSGVTLKSAGVNSMKGLCPFHDEKSPSFTVRPTHGTYRCFGCGQGGDAITYVQEQQGMSFIDAVRYVAELYSVDIKEDEDDSYDGPSRKRLLSLMATVAEFFSQNYRALEKEHPARQELIKRDLDMFANEGGVGYAPDGWTRTKEYLESKGFTEEDMRAVGIISQSSTSERTYDAFRGRVTWSIKDISGRVIGFGARKIFETDQGPKYLNTPETILYHKSQVLYNLDIARAHASKQSLMYVVEGYTDVMAFNAAGIYNVVASCGTAFGESHATTVRRIVGEEGKIIFCFDGDEAGLKAARKTFDLKAPIHAQSQAVMFTSGDPCDVRLAHGNSGLIKAIEDGLSPLTSFVLKHELNLYNTSTSEGRSQYLKSVTPLLAGIPDASLRDDYMRKVTLWSGSTLDVVNSMVRRAINDSRQKGASSYQQELPPQDSDMVPPDSEESIQVSELRHRQEKLLSLIITHPDAAYRSNVHKRVNIKIFPEDMRPLLSEILTLLEANPSKVESLHPERSRNPELMNTVLNMEDAVLNRRIQMGGNATALAERVIQRLMKSIDAYIKNEHYASIRATTSSALEGDNSNETSEEVEKMYMQLRNNRYI